MRPAGEVRQALLGAATRLAQQGRAVTLREMAAGACVGLAAAERTVDNMRRAGVLVKVGERRVCHRNRPVAEYLPADLVSAPQGVDIGRVMQVWAG